MKDILKLSERIDAYTYCKKLRTKGLGAVVEEFSFAEGPIIFIVKLPEEQYDQYKILFPEDIPSEPADYDPMVKCPYCGNSDVKEPPSPWDSILCIFIIPLFVHYFLRKQKGFLYICKNCNKSFRFKL